MLHKNDTGSNRFLIFFMLHRNNTQSEAVSGPLTRRG